MAKREKSWGAKKEGGKVGGGGKKIGAPGAKAGPAKKKAKVAVV